MTAPASRRSLRFAWLVAILLTGCSTVPAAPRGGSLPPPSREVLANGMRLIIQEHHASNVVALQLWVGVGARDEAPSERGFSHLVEHMLFKGTTSLGRGFVDREIESVGGWTNAATSYDYTSYYLLLPAGRTARGIELLADMGFNAAFDQEEMAREREVVFEEVRLGEDNVRTFFGRRLQELVFQGHPYGFPVLGDAEALKAATRASLYGYYQRHYVPANMTLVVVGAIDPALVRTQVTRAFGAAAQGERRAVTPPSPTIPDAGRERVLERPERQASLGFAWAAPELGHPDMFAVDVLAHVLGGARSSRLTQALRERARIVSSISAGYSALARGGVFTVTAQFEPADEPRVWTGILDEVKRLQDGGVTAQELERAKTASESSHEFSRETVEGRAGAYGQAETTWSLDAELHYLDGIRAVTAERVRDAARRYLAAPHVRLALHPKAGGL